MFEYEKVKDTFCIVPWVQLFIHSTGTLRVCCLFQSPLLDNDGMREFDVYDIDNINAIMNTTSLKDIRLSMLKGIWVEGCRRCQDRERAGGKSVRYWLNINFKDFIPQLLNTTRADGSIDPKILSLDIRLGNTCNLRCRMCYTGNSVNLIKDFEKLFPDYEQEFSENKSLERLFPDYEKPFLELKDIRII